ncbi:helix-turn-helix transcriptional regulator [Rhodomicrobium udaipurense]|uniref:Helix-turn-helix transcriptional regulator n=1 Tax=Rhodomicrobium udaipurense TaxID=1202716 RepID=A0A8I1GG05_9HYPH|nr:helix-turn-helix transcriptional regulator [Rhodomicrobium udaipurense]MBJ7542630.1 helix-turn-helix transcriptional regulator [Rhodomicrobium udaipurense]
MFSPLIDGRLDSLLGLALDQFRAGLAVSRADGELVHANSAARAMAEAGWPIQIADGRLCAQSAEHSALLLRGIFEAAQAASLARDKPFERELPLSAMPHHGSLAIAMIAPLDATLDGRALVAVHIATFPSLNDCELPVVTKCFGLTKAEARTLDHLAKGLSVAAAATALSLSVNTVKTHLQNIFAKTGTARQKDLMKLVDDLRSPLAHI